MLTTNNSIPKLQHVFTVSELLKYDLIYIYHHLGAGSKVTLQRAELQIGGNYSYIVYFKGFKIGSLFVSSFFTAMYGQLDHIEASVSGITKERYLPTKAIDIVVSQDELRLVS